MKPTTRDAIVARLVENDAAVEVGIGNRPDVATALASTGVAVTATDLAHRDIPGDVEFVVDDVTNPGQDVYDDADVLYALNLPPELHRPVVDVAREHGAAAVFTTLGAEQPVVPVRRETVPGDTLFWARE